MVEAILELEVWIAVDEALVELPEEMADVVGVPDAEVELGGVDVEDGRELDREPFIETKR